MDDKVKGEKTISTLGLIEMKGYLEAAADDLELAWAYDNAANYTLTKHINELKAQYKKTCNCCKNILLKRLIDENKELKEKVEAYEKQMQKQS